MNIAIMSHDNRKDLMVQFCTAYAGILSQHNLYATNTTGHMVAEATGLKVHCFLSYAHGGSQQIGARIAYNEFDLVLFFNDPSNEKMAGDLPPVRPEQCALRQQHCHSGNAGTGSGPG
jgi:methylglyoxal synthase